MSIQTSQRAALDRFTFAELHMGVRTRLIVYARDEAHARHACRRAFDRISQLENSMSDYRLNSEINHLAKQAGGAPVKISNDLFFVLVYAQEIARLTDGAFDPTVSPLVRLWREARREKRLPDKKKFDAARQLVGWKKLKLNRKDQTAQLLKKGMQLDLGAIAKGYAGDCALNVLKAQGISSALFEAGGDVVLSAAPPGTKGWKIEVENASASGAPRVVELQNAALGASGDTNQFVVIGGKRYSHVVDAKTGLGLTNRVAVTVIAPRGILSDSLSTAWSLADNSQRRRLQRAFPQAQVFLRYLK
ncbi:MAG TPA: FAD:protein FMN transferase [Abditibacteriaceae bacterium]